MVAMAGFAAPAAFAAGAPAGTQIPNAATLTYSIGGRPATPVTAVAPVLVVAEVINVVLTWQDGTPVAVNSPDAAKALTFVLTNTGNGTEAFGLARNLGIEVVLPRGALVLVGENAAPWTIEEGKVFRRKDFYMIRTFYFPIGDFEPNVALLRRYKDEYRVLVDGEFGLKELPQNFAHFAEGRLIKPVLAPGRR